MGKRQGGESELTVDQSEGIELEAVVEEPEAWPKIRVVESPQKVARIKLRLMIENGSKFTRGKSKARQEIESFVLSQYQMHKPRKDGSEYEIKIPYATDEELQKEVDDLYQEMATTAYDRNCFIEATMKDMDDEDRWF